MELSPEQVLKQYWGYDQFRPLQLDIIQSVLAGKDTLALMPTGGGKSVCFQVPALCRPGVCIVISPLIALMKDQVHNLKKVGVPTAAIYSGMSPREIDITLDNCVHGNVKLLYLSPERIQTSLAIERIKRMNVNLIAIDEAHCISQWGYDFRPSYLKIAEIRPHHPNVPILALTATATPKVVLDIQEKLAFRKSLVLQKSFYRSNLAYVVVKEAHKRNKLLEVLKAIPGTGIVYVNSRKMTKDVARYLISQGISADYYHAGLDKTERSQKQEAWIESKTRIMVATNAFGMGIDHPKVRVVAHIHPSPSLEAYFQEAGRGGRDGEKAYAILLYDDKDIPALEEKLEKSFPPISEIKKVYLALGSYFQIAVGSEGKSFDFDISAFCEYYKLNLFNVYSALKILEECNYLYLTEAVFQPSTLLIKVSREKLYEYLLQNGQMSDLLRTLLRMYQGIQDQAVSIDEYKLSKILKVSKETLINQLMYLNSNGLIDYTPSKDQPQVGFVEGRVSADVLYIDPVWYLGRKKWRQNMLEGVKRYLLQKECRSILLLDYFGESSKQACGICDVCLYRARKAKWSEELPGITDKIKDLLGQGPISMESILQSFPSSEKKVVKFALQELCDEEMVVRKGMKYCFNQQEDV